MMLLVVACHAASLRPAPPADANAGLKESVKRDGLAVVADGCLHVHSLGNFAGLDVARKESLATSRVIAARADLALSGNGFAPRVLAVPRVCGIEIGGSTRQQNRLLWTGDFWGLDCDPEKIDCAYRKSDGGSLWRLLEPLH